MIFTIRLVCNNDIVAAYRPLWLHPQRLFFNRRSNGLNGQVGGVGSLA